MGSFRLRPSSSSVEHRGTPDGPPPVPAAPPAESPPVDFPPDVLLAEVGLIITAGGAAEGPGFPAGILAAEAGLTVTAGAGPVPAELATLAEQVGHEVAARLRCNPTMGLLFRDGDIVSADYFNQIVTDFARIASLTAIKDLQLATSPGGQAAGG